MATKTRYPNLDEGASAPQLSAQPAPESEVSLLDLLIVLVERKRVILLVTGAFAFLSIVVSLILPVSYTATAVLLPPPQNSSLASTLMSQLGGGLGSVAALAGGSFSLKNPNDMYVAMLHSRTVEDEMVDNFHLQAEYHKRYLSDARKRLEHNCTIDGDGKDGLIRISIQDHDPKRAAELTNGYVEAFHDLTKNLAITEASQRRRFFGDELQQTKDNLAQAEEALKQTQQTTGLLQLDSQARALIETAAGLRAQITAREVQLDAMKTYATGENSQVVEIQQALDSLRAQLAKLGGSEEDPNSLIVPKGMVPEAGLEYVRKVRDVKYYETMFELLARQYELAKLDEAKEGSLIQIVDPAIPPDRRSYPKRSLIVIGCTMAGFFIGVLIALSMASIARMKADPESNARLALLKSTLRSRNHPVA
jgi:tyrosine-protein kinase Etk/Wzc